MASQEQVAEHLGISQSQVSKLVRQGILPTAERGQFDLEACRLRYIRDLEQKALHALMKRHGYMRPRARLA